MEPVIFVLSLVLFSYVVAEYVFRVWHLPFFLSGILHSGIGFIMIGVIVGPLGLGWLDATKLDLFVSPTCIVLSWAGFVFGLQFRWQSLRLISMANYRMAVIQALVVFFVVVFLLFPIRWIVPGMFLSLPEALPLVFALAAIASVSAPTGVAAVVRRFRAHGMTTRMLQYISASDAVVGIVLFGTVLSFFRSEGMAGGAFFSGLVWLVATLGIGALLGFLYHIFLVLRLSSNERLVVAVGMIVLAAGAASYLKLSPLFLSMIIGIVLANFSDNQDRLFRMLVSAERPLFGLMLILAGAHWLGFEPVSFGLGIAFVAFRAFGKIIGARVAFESVYLEKSNLVWFGLALTGEGGIALAMALDFMSRYSGPVGELLLSAIVVAFFINCIFAPYFIRRVLILKGGIS